MQFKILNMELLIGIVCGIALSLFFSFGPAFFSLIQNSIHYGFKRTIAFVVGVSLSDILMVFLMLTVLRNLDMDAAMHNIYVATIGGIVIGWIGVHTIRRRATVSRDRSSRLRFKNKEEMHRWQLMLHGFLLNFLNPLIWLYWVSLITILSAEVGLTSSERYIFFAGLLIAVLGMDILKCRLASMMQTWFTARRLNWFNTITGSILIIFAVYLVVSMILYQTNPDIREKEQDGTSQRSRIVQTVHQHIAKDSAKISHDTVQFR